LATWRAGAAPKRGPRREAVSDDTEGQLRNLRRTEPTAGTILACKCGELVIVLGGEDEWRSEGPAAVFECGVCDAKITLPEDEGRDPQEVDYHALTLGELIKELKPRYG
jgi:hypothetical protein